MFFTLNIFAASPSNPILPSDNIQDPGDVSTPWGGCGPADNNCFIQLTSFTNENVTGLDYSTSTGVLSLTAGYTIPTTASTTEWATAIGALDGSALLQNGNSFGNTLTLGTNDNNALSFETNSNTAMTILANGNVGVGTSTPNEKLSVAGNVYLDGFALASYFYTSSTTATSTFSNVSINSLAQGVRVTYPNGQVKFFQPSSDTNAARGQALLSAVSAATASTTIDIGPGDYLLTSPITILNGQTYRLNGSRIYHTTSENSQTMFNAASVHDWSMYGPGTIEGSGFGTGAAEVGLNTQSSYRWRIDGITFRGFKSTGLQVNNSNYGVGDKFPTGQISNLVFEYNNIGTYVGGGAEFIEWTNITWTRNNTGMQLFAGNNQFFNSNMLQNVNYGLRLYATGSGNHGHGKWVGGSFGHNPGTSLWVEQNFIWGFTFVGTHFYGDTTTSGWLDLSGRGVRFNGGNLDAPIRASSTPTGIHVFQDMYIAGSNATTSALSTTSRSMIKFYQNQTDTGPWMYNDAIPVADGGTGTLYLTPGSILLGNGSSTIATTTSLYFDNGNSFIGVGTTTPTSRLTVAGDIDLSGVLKANGSSGTSGYVLQTTGTGLQWVDPASLGVGGSSQWTTNGINIYYSTGNTGLGTSTPSSRLTVAGDIDLSGAIKANGSAGVSGQILQTTATGVQWVATSSLGITGGGVSSQWTTDASNIYYNTGNVGIGTTTPLANLSVVGNSTSPTSPVFQITNTASGSFVPSFSMLAPNLTAGQSTYMNFGQSQSTNNSGSILYTYAGSSSTNNRLGFNFYGGSEVLSILASGNIGMGTTTPISKLSLALGQIEVPSGSVSAPAYVFGGDLNTGMYQAAANQLDFAINGINYLSISTAGTVFLSQTSSLRGGSGTAANPYFTFSGDPSSGMYRSAGTTLGFSTNGTTRLFIDTSGNIGIGTTTPGAQLNLNIAATTASTPLDQLRLGWQDAGVDLAQGFGTKISFWGSDANNAGVANLEIANIATYKENETDGTDDTALTFFTRSGATLAESLRISGNGFVGIGTTTPADKLQVFGDIRLGTSGVNGCIKDYAGTGIVGVCSSDERLKTNIVDLSDGYLEKLVNLKVITYNWNEEANQLNKVDTTVTNYGLLAQNVESIFPELVTTDSKGYKQVNYSRLPLYLLKSVQELSKKVTGIFDGTAKVKVKELCIEDVCVTKDQLQQLLQGQNIQPVVVPAPTPTPTPTPEPEPVIENDVTETPPTPEPVVDTQPINEPAVEPTPVVVTESAPAPEVVAE